MSIPEDQKLILDIVQQISRYISVHLSVSSKGSSLWQIKVNAQSLFEFLNDNFKCPEQTFVQALNYAKLNLPPIYNSIDVPCRWNGGSKAVIPEAYKTKGKILCKVKVTIQACQVYTEIEPERIWKVGDFVWVPESHPVVLELLTSNAFELIDFGD